MKDLSAEFLQRADHVRSGWGQIIFSLSFEGY